MDELTKLVENSKLKPFLNKPYSLSNIGKVHNLLETKAGNNDFYGKIGIDMEEMLLK